MRVAVRYDTPGWAFHRRALDYAQFAPDGWEVIALAHNEPTTTKRFDALLQLDCQGNIKTGYPLKTAKLVASHAWLHDPSVLDWRTRGANYYRCRTRLAEELEKCDAVAVYNNAQREAVETVTGKRVVMCPYGVNTSIFKPTSVNVRSDSRLRVGWCYQVSGGLVGFKGLTEILIPLIARLGDTDYDWDIKTPAAGAAMSSEELALWYQDLDVFLCTSMGEGGPQGPFEAAACGCLVISTDVGQITDWTALGERGLVLPSYGNSDEAKVVVEEFARILEYYVRRRNHVRDMGMDLAELIRTDYCAADLCPRQLKELFG